MKEFIYNLFISNNEIAFICGIILALLYIAIPFLGVFALSVGAVKLWEKFSDFLSKIFY